MYGNSTKASYKKEFGSSVNGWTSIARRPTGAEQDALFTSQEKEAEGMARKLTVKRTKTLREGPRVAPGERMLQEGKIPAYEAFYKCLLEQSKAVFIEQNFIVRMFHASSNVQTEFTDMVAAVPPEQRNGVDLLLPNPPDFGGPYGVHIKSAMQNIFFTWQNDIANLANLLIGQDIM